MSGRHPTVRCSGFHSSPCRPSHHNEKYMRTIDELNRQNQEKDFLIKTYQDMIQTRNGLGDISEDNNNIRSNPELFDTKKTFYYCSICSGKKFKSQKYLDEHMERRHFNQKV